jgi:hypothetical protein
MLCISCHQRASEQYTSLIAPISFFFITGAITLCDFRPSLWVCSIVASHARTPRIIWELGLCGYRNSTFFWCGVVSPSPSSNLEDKRLHFVDMSGRERELCSGHHSFSGHCGSQTSSLRNAVVLEDASVSLRIHNKVLSYLSYQMLSL